MTTTKSPTVKTALRVIEIIELFAREKQPLSLTEISRALKAPVSSCLALIRTLMQLGYLYETGKRQSYYPTSRLYIMAQKIYDFDPVLEQVRPSLEALCNATEETVVLGRFTPDMKVMYIEAIESTHPIRYVAVAGMRRDFYANSIGKALLSQLPEDERKRLLKNTLFEKFNKKTLVTPEQIEADLQKSLERGWYENSGESIADVGGIAWPLRLNGALYAISIAGPIYRIQENLFSFAEKLRTVCHLLEKSSEI